MKYIAHNRSNTTLLARKSFLSMACLPKSLGGPFGRLHHFCAPHGARNYANAVSSSVALAYLLVAMIPSLMRGWAARRLRDQGRRVLGEACRWPALAKAPKRDRLHGPEVSGLRRGPIDP